MSVSLLISMATAAATAGLSCGVSCGACGSPVSNVFLSSYLFTHSGRLTRSVFSFCGFYIGKMAAVILLCLIASWAGGSVIDEAGTLLGVNLRIVVQIAMFAFALLLIARWIYTEKRQASDSGCNGCKAVKRKNYPMLVCGFFSGISPCAPLVLVMGYSAALSGVEAIILGVAFSLANSILPLILLVILTGALSKAMFKEIPGKIKWFQLGSYVMFAVISGVGIIRL